jgi:AcrR family transcriptional regulator
MPITPPPLPYSWQLQIQLAVGSDLSAKQVAILIAAVELFSAKGFAATTTKEIAARAGVSEGLIFKHYTSKEELLTVVVDLICSSVFLPLLHYGLDELVARQFSDLTSFFQTLLENRAELFRENTVPIRLLLQELPHHAEMRTAFFEELGKLPIWDTLTVLRAREFLPALPVTEILHILAACFSGYFLTRYIMFPEYFAAFSERDQELFIKFLVSGLRGCADEEVVL